jgi:hypothetical protein
MTSGLASLSPAHSQQLGKATSNLPKDLQSCNIQSLRQNISTLSIDCSQLKQENKGEISTTSIINTNTPPIFNSLGDILPSIFIHQNVKTEAFRQKYLTNKVQCELNLHKQENKAESYTGLAVVLLYLSVSEESESEKIKNFKLAEQHFLKAKNLNYFHYLVHFCDYTIHLYKGVKYEIAAIKQAILMLRRSLALMPTYQNAQTALTNVVDRAKQKWRELAQAGKISEIELKQNISQLEQTLKQDPFEGENIPFDHIHLAPVEFLKNYPQYLTKANYTNRKAIIDVSSFDGTPESLRNILMAHQGNVARELYVKYNLTAELADVIRYAMFVNNQLKVCFYSEGQLEFFKKSFQRDICHGTLQQETIATNHPQLVTYRISSHPSKPMIEVILSTTEGLPILTTERAKSFKQTFIKGKEIKPEVISQDEYMTKIIHPLIVKKSDLVKINFI